MTSKPLHWKNNDWCPPFLRTRILRRLLVLPIETKPRVFREALPLIWGDIDFQNHVLRLKHISCQKTFSGVSLLSGPR
jgi:hypothetical protein